MPISYWSHLVAQFVGDCSTAVSVRGNGPQSPVDFKHRKHMGLPPAYKTCRVPPFEPSIQQPIGSLAFGYELS